MRSLLQGEHRRAVIMGAAGLVALAALLVFRALSVGGADSFAPAVPVAPAGIAPQTPSVPAPPPPSAPVDPALLRDPFCPLVAEAAGGAARVTCRRRPPPAGRRAVGLEDVFFEAAAPRARMHVGSVTFPNLHEGERFADTLTVVSLADRCGEFEHDGTRFELCEGEETFR